MGQARLRGPKELRVAQAVLRAREIEAQRAAERMRRDAEERKRIAAMPPEQRRRHQDKLHRQRMTAAALCGLVYGLVEPAVRRRHRG